MNLRQLIWRLGTHRFHLRVPDLHLSCSDLTQITGYQDSSPSYCHQVMCPHWNVLGCPWGPDCFQPAVYYYGGSCPSDSQWCCAIGTRGNWGELQFIYSGTSLSRWYHQMEAFSTLLALCAGNSPVTSEFPSQRASNVDFDVGLHKLLNKQANDRWFETIWRSCDVIIMNSITTLSYVP